MTVQLAARNHPGAKYHCIMGVVGGGHELSCCNSFTLGTPQNASSTPRDQRCQRPGCKAGFEQADAANEAARHEDDTDNWW